MQLLSNITHYLKGSPPSADKRPDNRDTPASDGVEEAGEPEARSGITRRGPYSNVVERNSAVSVHFISFLR
jgi:hypothetical protein